MPKTEQLSLFDAVPDVAGVPVDHSKRRSGKSLAPAGLGTVKIEPPPSLPMGAKWREVNTPHQPIGFTLMRSRRRSIGLQITDDGLRVTAPQWVGLRQVDEAVISKAPWILGKLAHYQSRKERLAMAQTQWCDGGQIPYLGKRIRLSLGHALRVAHTFSGNPLAPLEHDLLKLNLPISADHARIRDSVDVWLQGQALAWFRLRLEAFDKQFGLTPAGWRLSAAATRWGSCNCSGNIMLNWRLIHFEPAIIDYVIAHELAHLSFMNHSRDFWQEVERLCPGFQVARDQLRGHDPAALPLL